MVNWSDAGGIAAVISAMYLPFILSPAAYGFLQTCIRWLAELLWPAQSFCTSMLWDDVPDGKVHDCQSLAAPYFGTDCHCVADAVHVVFSRAFRESNVKSRLVKKPKQLALGHSYIHTDVFTLLAFLLCSTDREPSCSEIKLEEVDSVIVAQIHWRAREKVFVRPDMTKKTVEGILAGYPPWYREFLVVSNGVVVPHPLQCRDDIFRAGWVIAVGLSETWPLPRSLASDDIMDQPIKRVLHKLEDDILPHFPDDRFVEIAIKGLKGLVHKSTGSGMRTFLRACKTGKVMDMTGSDCIFAMTLFNQVEPLTVEEVAKLSLILAPVVYVAFKGAFNVVQHCKHGHEKFRIPSDMEDFRQPVYLDLVRV